MGSIPQIFDEAALTLGRHRVRRQQLTSVEGARSDFLIVLAAQDICDRLDLVRRTFTSALVFGGHAEGLTRVLLERPGMERVEVADTVLPYAGDPRVVLRPLASLEVLGLPDETFDLIVSPLMLQWINDLPGVLAQLRRALKPDGLLIANLIGGRSLHELRASFLAGEADLPAGVSPHVHPMIDVREMGGLLQRAKFALPVADADAVTVTYAHPLALMRELRAMGARNVLAERRRGFMRRDTLGRVVEHYLSAWPGERARVAATFELVTATGWAPHESQQKPLKPGSAQQRLADALGVTKTPGDLPRSS
jgi:NADH dehydrogenase [ubiquinone] 1 alpha subcomplex assembly factor 5